MLSSFCQKLEIFILKIQLPDVSDISLSQLEDLMDDEHVNHGDPMLSDILSGQTPPTRTKTNHLTIRRPFPAPSGSSSSTCGLTGGDPMLSSSTAPIDLGCIGDPMLSSHGLLGSPDRDLDMDLSA